MIIRITLAYAMQILNNRTEMYSLLILRNRRELFILCTSTILCQKICLFIITFVCLFEYYFTVFKYKFNFSSFV